MGRRRQYTDDQALEACAAIAEGATMAEACRIASISYPAFKMQVRRGADAKKGSHARWIREKVLEAQALFELQVRHTLFFAAKQGKPKALEEILRRSERLAADVTPEEAPPADRESWLRWRLAKVRGWIAEESGIAKTKLLSVERDLMRELEQFEPEEEPTPEQLLEELIEGLEGWSDDELLAVHAEGLRREIPGFVPRPFELRVVGGDA